MKQINVAVVGLSGTEKDRGQLGVGKSCLCNRFVRPMTDDYFIDHISVLSQSDFSGRVINNDHFLYWGDVKKTSDEGVDYHFNVIEQTEFIDDATFQPFKVGKMESYVKRCINTKICSAEKLMYICKSQLGVEKEFEEKVLPDGRFSVDGYVCTFDVSSVPNRSVERQADFICALITQLMKTKKPIVLVTTKNDEANELYVREAEKICQRKEFKGSLFMVESSAHEAINVDLGFILLAQIIDKTKVRSKLLSYQEAARSRKELLDASTEAVTRLIRNQISDYHTIWLQASKILAHHKEWNDFHELFGKEAGQRIFRRHIKKLREENINRQLQMYMENFASVLQDIIPSTNVEGYPFDNEWSAIQDYLKNHIDYDQYFFECLNVSWTELCEMTEMEDEQRIPFDVLDTPEAETVFKNHINALQQEQKKLEWKKQFKKLLEEAGYVTPGKQLSEVRVLFMGRECFEALSEHDCQQIYDNHQREIIEKAKYNFQELLLEHADLFYHFKSIEPSGTITQDDIKEITDVLQEDLRYKMLDRLDQDRKVMLFQHLGFVHCPIREHCPAFPNCMDSLIERIMSSRKTQSMTRNQWRSSQTQNDNLLSILVLGSDRLAADFINDVYLNCNEDRGYYYEEMQQTFFVNHKLIDGDIDTFKNIDFQSNGLICLYSNQTQLVYLRDCLVQTVVHAFDMHDKFDTLPIVLIYQPEEHLEDIDNESLKTDGQQLADMVHGLFLDTPMNFYQETGNEDNYVSELLNHLIDSLRLGEHKSDEMCYPLDSKDIRIILCMFCGDPYSVENALNSILTDPNYVRSGERSIVMEMFLGDTKRRIEIIISSYHGANAFRDELVHGFILLYSTKRKASLATLNAFSMNIPNLPMQIIAVADGGANAFFTNDICQMLMTEGNAVADRLRAHFMTSSSGIAFYAPFLKEVWEKKPEIEKAFHMEEPVTLDSGEGTLEHSMRHMPQPPPRHDSYLLKNSLGGNNGTDGSGSENYDQLPTRSMNSLNGTDDNQFKFNLNDNSDKYSNLYMIGDKDMGINSYTMNDDDKDERSRLIHQGFQIYPPPTTPPEPAPPDNHMAASSIMRSYKSNLASESQSSLDDITSDVSGSKDSLTTHDSGWLDEALPITTLLQRTDKDNNGGNRRPIMWNNFSSHHAFTTGRHRADNNFTGKVRPKGPSQTLKQPGKLNLKNFAIVNEAIARMNVNSDNVLEGDKSNKLFGFSINKIKPKLFPNHAPLARPEDDSDEIGEYAQVKEIYPTKPEDGNDLAYQYSQDATPNKTKSRIRREKDQQESDSESSSSERNNPTRGFDGYYKMKHKGQTRTKPRKKRQAIPVQPPKIPFGTFVSPPEIPMLYQKMKNDKMMGMNDKTLYNDMHEEESSIDVSSPRDNNSPIFGIITKDKEGDREKLIERKREKLKSQEEKLEKRREKEDAAKARKQLEKEKEQEKRLKRKSKQNSKSSAGGSSAGDSISSIPSIMSTENSLLPVFLEKCVQFIEKEGLDSEGIYRVPGNRAHVDLLYQKFVEENNGLFDIEALDIPVNAVATALKDFFSKHLPPLFDKELMIELEDIAGSRGVSVTTLSMEVKTDRSSRLLALRGLLDKMPAKNFTILKYIFQHFVRVSENSKYNSMDSKNLAICWWPTLIPIEFTDMGHFEQLRPYLEDIVQTMIDQYPFLFCGQEAFVMV